MRTHGYGGQLDDTSPDQRLLEVAVFRSHFLLSLVFDLLLVVRLLPLVADALLDLQPPVARVEAGDEDAGEEGEESGQHQHGHWRRRGHKATHAHARTPLLSSILALACSHSCQIYI